MRKAFSEEEFDDAYLTAKAEAKACFGDDDMYLEKLILNPKHIELLLPIISITSPLGPIKVMPHSSTKRANVEFSDKKQIAVRLIRTCQELGIEAVAVYSDVDSTSLHVQLADHAVCIGPAKATDSYLNMKNILSVATALGCDAIHPGFGFLSENSTFARLVEECGITFIGPSAIPSS